MSFGATLQQLRKKAGLSQVELAQQSSSPIDSLRNWEQDRALPKIDAATRLARALGVSLDLLAVEAESPARSAPKGASSKKPRGRPRKEP